MNKKIAIIISLILTVACLGGIVVSATSSSQPGIQRVDVLEDKNYYAYYNDSSCKGAVAFCLNNQFVSYGATTESIRLCTKNADGTYTALYTIDKASLSTWFAGKKEYNLATEGELSSLLGGLNGIGFTLDSGKTNLAFELNGQPIKKGTAYYVYIPADFYVDAQGLGNNPVYLSIRPSDVNAYTGDLFEDLKTAASGIYDAVLFAAESIGGVLS
ncbi:MAG: hypothetical protein IJZ20_05465 [Clostridia bacterium]|nr:hypothetical protein [Clostridia bacterium]